MLFYFTEVSKYIDMILILFYVAECVHYEVTQENFLTCNGIVARQRIIIFLIQLVSFGTLCLKKGSFDYIFLCMFIQIFLFTAIYVTSLIYPRSDKILMNNMTLLLSVGFIVISRLNFNKAFKQFAIVAVSLIIGMFIPKIIHKWRTMDRFQWVYATCGLMPLLIVLILGTATHGSKISFTIGGITFQPSEFVKLVFVLCMASMLTSCKNMSDLFLTATVAGCHIFVLAVSKDLGAALVYFVAFVFMLYLATKKWYYLLAGGVSGAVASIAGYKLFSHVRVRVMAYLDPFTNIENQGYQISQSLFAIGSGDLFGLGLSKGVPSDIPFVDSDFIFSAICEEMGMIFGTGVLLVCFSCFLIMMRSGFMNRKLFYRLVASGLGVIYIFQVFLTVGGSIKFIPLTGVTLPLVSYGGSSVLISVLIFYICQGVITLERDEEYWEWRMNYDRRMEEREDYRYEKE